MRAVCKPFSMGVQMCEQLNAVLKHWASQFGRMHVIGLDVNVMSVYALVCVHLASCCLLTCS